MANEPRTIKGPCFDECKDGRNPDGTRCKCEYFALTEPHGVRLGLDDLMFDGAKWSRRETPADPFEEG
jgi:hypothetical protein